MELVQGQREIFSLASKVQKRLFSQKRSSGEDMEDDSELDSTSIELNTSVMYFVWTAAMALLVWLALSFTKGRKQLDQDGESC